MVFILGTWYLNLRVLRLVWVRYAASVLVRSADGRASSRLVVIVFTASVLLFLLLLAVFVQSNSIVALLMGMMNFNLCSLVVTRSCFLEMSSFFCSRMLSKLKSIENVHIEWL